MLFAVTLGDVPKTRGVNYLERSPHYLVFAAETMEFLGNADDEMGIQRIIEKWCKKARGSYSNLSNILRRFTALGNSYPIFRRQMKEEWEDIEDEWEERITKWTSFYLKESKVKITIKKPLSIGAKTKNIIQKEQEQKEQISKKLTLGNSGKEKKLSLPKRKPLILIKR